MPPKPGDIQSIHRILDILEVLAKHPKGIAITQLAQITGLHVSTVSRQLSTLVSRGYCAQDVSTKQYKPGSRLFELMGILASGLDLLSEAKPLLERLCYETNETVHLGILDGGEALDLVTLESRQSIRVYRQNGARFPVHCSAVGKVLLAFAPEETVESIVRSKGLQRSTRNTITTPAALRAELQKVHQQGFAVDKEEFEPDVCCAAVPVRNHAGQVIAAVGVTGLVRRLNPEDENVLSLLRRTAQDISLRLGWRAPGEE